MDKLKDLARNVFSLIKVFLPFIIIAFIISFFHTDKSRCDCCLQNVDTEDTIYYESGDETLCVSCSKHLRECPGCHEKFIENYESKYIPYCDTCYASGQYIDQCRWCGELKTVRDLTEYSTEIVCYKCLLYLIIDN